MNAHPTRPDGAPLTVDAYRTLVLADAPAPTPIDLPLESCAGLIVADDVVAALPVPAFTNSAMDGFAVRVADLGGAVAGAGDSLAAVTLPVSADVPAGSAPAALRPGTAARIMTGAPLPDGADAVIPVELTDSEPGPRDCPATVTVSADVAAAASPGDHVRVAGGDVRPGDVVLRTGDVLDAAALAAAASVGHGTLRVFARPRVAIVATGEELVAPGAVPGPGQIPDSNTILLTTLLRGWGADVTVVRGSGDTADDLAEALARAAEAADIVITSGGISAGAYDPVKTLAADGRADIAFHRLRQQPGGPQAFGHVGGDSGGGTLLIGLPGNPVSVFVSAILYVRPVVAVAAGAGRDVVKPETMNVTADADFRARPGKTRFVPVTVDGGLARPVHASGLGSHLIGSLHLANALLVVPEADADAITGPDATYSPGATMTAIPLDPALRREKDRHA